MYNGLVAILKEKEACQNLSPKSRNWIGMLYELISTLPLPNPNTSISYVTVSILVHNDMAGIQISLLKREENSRH